MPASGKTEQLVYALIIKHPWLVEDDKLLLLAVWRKQGLVLTAEQKEEWFSNCSTPESITRIRRKLLEEKLIVQSEEAEMKRKMMAKKYHDFFSKQRSLLP